MPDLRHKTGFRGPSPDVGKATQFKSGQASANPGGRPSKFDRLISEAMRAQLAEKVSGDRSYASSIGENAVRVLEQQLAECAEKGRFKKELLPLIQFVTDRLEGKPRQQLDFNDITESLQGRSEEELLHYAQHGHWPNEENGENN